MRYVTIGKHMPLPQPSGRMAAARLARQGAITGGGAFVGGSILVFALMKTVGDVAGLVASIAPIAGATWGYAAMHGSSALWLGEPALLVLALGPAAILFVAGYSAAGRTSDLPVSPLVRGAAITVGYLGLATLVALHLLLGSGTDAVFEASFGGEVGLPPVALTFALAGVAFPVVFGGLGGASQARLEG